MTTDAPLYIDGKLVTEHNAWRFVKARRPNAKTHRERRGGWRGGSYSIVRDRTGGAPWCHATAPTAGEAWLKVARQMVEYDARMANERRALELVVAALTAAETPAALEAAALRYAAERVRQNGSMFYFGDERRRVADALDTMAAEHKP